MFSLYKVTIDPGDGEQQAFTVVGDGDPAPVGGKLVKSGFNTRKDAWEWCDGLEGIESPRRINSVTHASMKAFARR